MPGFWHYPVPYRLVPAGHQLQDYCSRRSCFGITRKQNIEKILRVGIISTPAAVKHIIQFIFGIIEESFRVNLPYRHFHAEVLYAIH